MHLDPILAISFPDYMPISSSTICPSVTTLTNSPHTSQCVQNKTKNKKHPSALSPLVLFFSRNTHLASHLPHPLFQSLSRFNGIGFVRTKRHSVPWKYKVWERIINEHNPFLVMRISSIKVGLGISQTNADSQWNPFYNAFHQKICCGNETIRR